MAELETNGLPQASHLATRRMPPRSCIAIKAKLAGAWVNGTIVAVPAEFEEKYYQSQPTPDEVAGIM